MLQTIRTDYDRTEELLCRTRNAKTETEAYKPINQKLKLCYYTPPHSETKMNTQWEALKNPQ